MSLQKQMQDSDTTLPQEEQPAEMVVDRWKELLTKMVERREEQPADRREEQPEEMVDRRGQEEPKPVNIPEPPHFYKIILSPHASKLSIPHEFVTEYGPNLGDLVLLEVPNGAIWKVKLQNTSGMTWLKEGWNKFKEYYSIGCGYFLLFRYNGNSHFSVFIFDLSASEIEYPPGPNEDINKKKDIPGVIPQVGSREGGVYADLTPNEDITSENRCVVYEPPEETVINLPPPGIYTMEELTSIPSGPNV
ncbi:B3 domain-containing protein At1g49475-like isoform X1 [Lycium ferocissimum]|uniref:B3 domain-containing protein At1g49475-like isoform X1 n=2 Tax=Lycium ferocissimum TaxID=112874 RepID=UPI00281610FF|nr:B3 domain-containing protein At1g49475-like isoform X1 [Lycium ferocissimum]